MVQQLSKTDSIFWSAVGIADLAERNCYLDEACVDDPNLRAQLDELLAAYPKVERFLEQPAGAAEVTSIRETAIAEHAGSIIGHYKLLQQIGEGGMGVVFMAEQTQLIQRIVALKIIKPGMDTRQVIARFEAERQALAMMDHPNIARVLDAGTTETGRPYFVMDLVKGVPITEYCDQQHLSVRQRLELMTQVCHAVQHAHHKGIIHRDLKPSNVLVAEYDGQPVPKIIDFGVAKATAQKLTERTMFTQYGQIVGTFEYMSPEQARFNQLDVDTRSDIYSLGVLLYELLAGSTPLEKERLRSAAFDEILRIISEEEPPKPSTRLSSSQFLHRIAANRHIEPKTLSGLVRGEIDWIVMKCLEKDRNRRYETASGLAHDIQRYLNDEPVVACPPSTRYRVAKFIRRYKAGVLTCSAILTSLAIASGISTWLYVRERDARRQAEFGSQILDVANAFHGNSPAQAEQFLASLAPFDKRMNPKNRAQLYFRLADLRGRQTWWKDSAEYFAKGLELEPNHLSLEPWHYYLPVLIKSGDLDGYLRMRQELLRRFGDSPDPRIAECVLKDCLLLPWPDANFAKLEQLANTTLEADDHWAREYFKFAKGLLDYRRGNYELAVRTPQGSVTSDTYLIVSAAMVRAMALHRLGQPDEARKLLSYWFEFAQLGYSREVSLIFNRNWNDWIVAHTLIDEASDLIDPKLVAGIPSSLATSSHPATAANNLYHLALEKLRSGDQAGYRRACALVALVPECSFNTVAEFRRHWIFCLDPQPLEDLKDPLKRAERLLAKDSLDADYTKQLVLGAMLYRMGEYKTAAQHLEASIATYPSQPPHVYGTAAYPRLLLSMAKLRMGEHAEARRLFAETEPTVKLAIESRMTVWDYRTAIEVLYQEAKALMSADRINADSENGNPAAGEQHTPDHYQQPKAKRGR